MRTATRAAAAVLALALAGTTAAAASPATAQPGAWEIRLESTGATTAALVLDSAVIPLSTNTEHPYGWSGDGAFVMQPTGGGAGCRIVANGQEVAAATAPDNCRWP